MKTKILKANPPSIKLAAKILKKGGLVAFPTETVYGLGADAFNSRAVAKIFEAKNRPHFDPLIVHISSFDQLETLWKEFSPTAKKLAHAFWPGPLTLVLPKKREVPDLVTAGLETVAVRMPAHPVALKLLQVFGSPIAAPSANLFNRTSPTQAEAVRDDLGGRIDLILDGGPCRVGVESTVLKLEGSKAILLRPGGVPVEAIRAICPVHLERRKKGVKKFYSPGEQETHYAPLTPFVMMGESRAQFQKSLRRYFKICTEQKIRTPRIGGIFFKKPLQSPLLRKTLTLSKTGSLTESASNLFKMIRGLDKIKLDLMIAEPVKSKELGVAITNRLSKATSGKVGIKIFFNDWIRKNS